MLVLLGNRKIEMCRRNRNHKNINNATEYKQAGFIQRISIHNDENKKVLKLITKTGIVQMAYTNTCTLPK